MGKEGVELCLRADRRLTHALLAPRVLAITRLEASQGRLGLFIIPSGLGTKPLEDDIELLLGGELVGVVRSGQMLSSVTPGARDRKK